MTVFDLGELMVEAVPVSFSEVKVGGSYLCVTVDGGGFDSAGGFVQLTYGIAGERKFSEFFDFAWAGVVLLTSVRSFENGWVHMSQHIETSAFLVGSYDDESSTLYKVTSVNGVRM